jgi:HK97 family phage prohead protease
MSKYLTTNLEIKSLNDREFEGHGSIFGNEDLGGDIVLPGAFTKTLSQYKEKGDLPQMFWMHDPSRVAGKWTEMREDDAGLRVKGILADTPLGNEIRTLLKMDAVKGLSIGYRTIKDSFNKAGQRLLKELELWEVSVVSLPMNPLAQVAHAKSQLSAAGEYVPTAREFEHALRDVGCSQKTAKRIISKVYEDEERDVVESEPENESRDVLDALEKIEQEAIARQIHDIYNQLKR